MRYESGGYIFETHGKHWYLEGWSPEPNKLPEPFIDIDPLIDGEGRLFKVWSLKLLFVWSNFLHNPVLIADLILTSGPLGMPSACTSSGERRTSAFRVSFFFFRASKWFEAFNSLRNCLSGAKSCSSSAIFWARGRILSVGLGLQASRIARWWRNVCILLS